MVLGDVMRNPFRKRKTEIAYLLNGEEVGIPVGYMPIAKSPEVQMAVNAIAGLIASMTIYLMRNTDKGDVRIKNELSKKVDIAPYRYMTRYSWVYYIVKNMIIKGNQIVLPRYGKDGRLEELKPLVPSEVSFLQNGDDYLVLYRGRSFAPDEVLHFLLNPREEYPWEGEGYTVELKKIVQSLAQAQETKTEFMSSKWKPSLIIRVNGIAGDLRKEEGRNRILNDYFSTSEAGKPWLVPAEQFEVAQVKPLSLNDLAIKDGVELDKKTVASMIGVPQFLLGVGDFKQEEYNNFIQTKIMQIATEFQQELTSKTIRSPDMYWMLNYRSLYNYTLTEKISAYGQMADRLAIDRNELREAMGMEPRDDMEELLGLENYIPASMLGQQKKLSIKGVEIDGE